LRINCSEGQDFGGLSDDHRAEGDQITGQGCHCVRGGAGGRSGVRIFGLRCERDDFDCLRGDDFAVSAPTLRSMKRLAENMTRVRC